MGKDRSDELMKALVAKLYATITGNDGNIKMPRNKVVTWLFPGIPFEPRDFLFCSKGVVGETAEQTKALQHQAFVISKLFDYIPDVGTDRQIIDAPMQQTVFTTTQDTISSVYRDVLKYSRVVNLELSDKEKEKLENFRNMLSVTKEVEDIFGEKKLVTEPGPLTLAYTAKMNDYLDAADEYMNLLIDAQSAKGSDSEALRRVAAWSNKSKFVRKRLEAAEMAWVSEGYKNEYESINAYIDQVTQKSMVLYKQDLLRKYNNGLLSSTNEGTAGDFYYTTLLGGNFATSRGWPTFDFYEGDYDMYYNKNISQWSSGRGTNFGFFSSGRSASGTNVEIGSSQKSTNFTAHLEFTQIPICRAWFEPGFFAMRGWTLDKLWDMNFDKTVSDGGAQPIGRLVAYPITALFVRKVVFKFDEYQSQSRYVDQQIQRGRSVGFGPFFVKGSYSHFSRETYSAGSDSSGGSIAIPGMQLIGFVNNLVPKCPNTNPAIKPEQFVGGEE